MERQFGKLSISTNGLLGNGGGDQRSAARQPGSSSVTPWVQHQHPHQNGGSGDQSDLAEEAPVGRQRTGRIRQERTTTWGGGGGRQIGGAADAAELAETLDLRLHQQQQESPRSPWNGSGGGGSPRYSTPDDHNHLAAISPRGVAGHHQHQAHSYHRRDRNPSGSGGVGGASLMVTEEDIRHASREVGGGGAAGDVGGSTGSGWQPSRTQNDVSARLLQKYKTETLRVEQQRVQQMPAAGLSKSHDGCIVPRRLPPIGGGFGGQRDAESGEEVDDPDDGKDETEEEEEDEESARRSRRPRGDGSGRQQLPSVSAGHKGGRTRTT